MSDTAPRILYCHCHYAQVVPREVKQAVLQKLCETGRPFDAVPDLCEMAARRDPLLKELAANGTLKIAACFPRAVKGLFHQCGADLAHDRSEVLNMRTQTAEEVAAAMLDPQLHPNLPQGKGAVTAAAPASSPAPTSA